MIRGLQPSMTYQFHVVAQNARGTSAPSEVLQVTTLIEVSISYLSLSLTIIIFIISSVTFCAIF